MLISGEDCSIMQFLFQPLYCFYVCEIRCGIIGAPEKIKGTHLRLSQSTIMVENAENKHFISYIAKMSTVNIPSLKAMQAFVTTNVAEVWP